MPLYVSQFVKENIFNCKNASSRQQNPSKYFYSAIQGELLRTARATLCLRGIIPKARVIRTHETTRFQAGYLRYFFQKIILAHPESFPTLYFMSGPPKPFIQR